MSTRAAALPIEPSTRALARMDRVVSWGGWAGRLAMRRWLEDVEVLGREHLAHGPAFLMMNHTSAFDPVLLTFHAQKPIQFVVTEPFMRVPVASSIAAWWGQVPKRKLEVDTRAIRTLKKWCQVGGIVGIFPEGQFPWDGRPLPLQPGLAQLVTYLDVPVVTARLYNGHRLWPPWAKHPRRTKLRLVIDPPHRFVAGEAIEAEIARRIHVDPDEAPSWPAHCKRPAEGLGRLLRYCPRCESDAALEDEHDVLCCRRCLAIWRVSADGVVAFAHDDGGRVAAEDPRSVAALVKRARSIFEARWTRTLALESRGEVEVLDVSRDASTRLATGKLRLARSRLDVGAFSLDLEDLLAHTLDWGERILLRTARQRLALVMRHDSRAVWTWAIDAGLRASIPRAEGVA